MIQFVLNFKRKNNKKETKKDGRKKKEEKKRKKKNKRIVRKQNNFNKVFKRDLLVGFFLNTSDKLLNNKHITKEY